MKSKVELVLPWPPSTNHTWGKATDKRTGKPQVYLTNDARVFRKSVATIVMGSRFGWPIIGPVEVKVTLCPPDNRKRDEDNFAGKALFDAMTQAGVWLDDSQIRRKVVEWGDVVKYGAVIVEIAPMRA